MVDDCGLLIAVPLVLIRIPQSAIRYALLMASSFGSVIS